MSPEDRPMCPYCTWPMKTAVEGHVWVCDNYGCDTELENGYHLKPCVVLPPPGYRPTGEDGDG